MHKNESHVLLIIVYYTIKNNGFSFQWQENCHTGIMQNLLIKIIEIKNKVL